MNLTEAQKVLQEDLKKKEQLMKEEKELRDKMDAAEHALSLKLATAIKDGKMQIGGYIVTGEEDEGVMETLNDMQEYEEQLYAGAEKEAYREARMAWLDKLLEIDSMDKEIMLAAAAAERESKANEPGGEDE